MSWNYRIVRYRDNGGYGLHEVYYDQAGKPWAMTADPAGFVCSAGEDPQKIIETLLVARFSANKHPVLDEPKIWPGINPADCEKPGTTPEMKEKAEARTPAERGIRRRLAEMTERAEKAKAACAREAGNEGESR